MRKLWIVTLLVLLVLPSCGPPPARLKLPPDTDDDKLGERLAEKPNVVKVDLYGTLITDEGVAHLTKYSTITRIDLWNTMISDEALPHLATMTQLEYLDLSYTGVSDEGLSYLKGLTNLTMLNLGKTDVSDEGRAEIQAALPDCEIVH